MSATWWGRVPWGTFHPFATWADAADYLSLRHHLMTEDKPYRPEPHRPGRSIQEVPKSMLHTSEQATCPIVDAPDNYHFERLCEDCDVKVMAGLNLGQVEDRFGQARISRNQLDAYRWVWALLSPAGSNPHWKNQPYVTDPDVRRISRKLLRFRGHPVPDVLSETAS